MVGLSGMLNLRTLVAPAITRQPDSPSACAPASTSGSILSANALHCRPGASKSRACPKVLAGRASTKSLPTSLPSSRPTACPGYKPGAQRQQSASKKDRRTCGLHLTVFSQTRQELLEKTVRNTASRDSLD